MSEPLIIAMTGETELALLPALANRHGCITGATGTGKTVTLQKLAESFSRIGVPVFMADVKGDLTGIAKAGVLSDKLKARLQEHGLPEPQLGRLSGHALGRLGRTGTSGARDGFRHGAAAAVAAARIERDAGRGAQHRLQGRR